MTTKHPTGLTAVDMILESQIVRHLVDARTAPEPIHLTPVDLGLLTLVCRARVLATDVELDGEFLPEAAIDYLATLLQQACPRVTPGAALNLARHVGACAGTYREMAAGWEVARWLIGMDDKRPRRG